MTTPRTLVTATLAYGSIFVPVGVSTAASRSDLRFKTLHSECGNPIKQSKHCSVCQSDTSLSSAELSKGYEISKNVFIVLDDEELDALSAERSRMIELAKYVPVGEITPLMIERTYWLTPNETLHAPYDLMARALEDLGMAGVGKATLWGKEVPVAVDSQDGVLMLMLLYCADEMVAYERDPDIWVEPDALMLAKLFIEMRADELSADDLTSESRRRALEYIEAKANNQALPEAKPMLDPQVTVDLMAELREMVAA